MLAATRGQGLLSNGTQRVAFEAIASDHEHELVTSNPSELAAYNEDNNPGQPSDDTYLDLGAA